MAAFDDGGTVTRVVPIVLSGLARGGDLRATITLTTAHPRCIDYDAVTAVVEVDGQEIMYQAIGITERSALADVATWLVNKFGTGVVRLVVDEPEPRADACSPDNGRIEPNAVGNRRGDVGCPSDDHAERKLVVVPIQVIRTRLLEADAAAAQERAQAGVRSRAEKVTVSPSPIGVPRSLPCSRRTTRRSSASSRIVFATRRHSGFLRPPSLLPSRSSLQPAHPIGDSRAQTQRPPKTMVKRSHFFDRTYSAQCCAQTSGTAPLRVRFASSQRSAFCRRAAR